MPGRVQVQDLTAPQDLRPVQTAGDTFGGAPRPDQNDNYTRLSEALGMAAKVAAQFQRQENKTIAQDAYRVISSTGDAELQQRYKDGTVPNLNNPLVAPVYGAQVGQTTARDLANSHMTAIRSGQVPAFDDAGNPTNMMEPLAQAARDYFTANPNYVKRPGFTQAFWQQMEKDRNTIFTMQQEKRVEHIKQHIQGGLAGGMDSFIREAGNPEASDDVVRNVWQKFRSDLRDRGAKSGVDIPWRELDDTMVGRLRENADKSPQAVLRILDLDRGVAPDGTKLGALKDIPWRVDDINSIRERARAEMERRTDVQAKESVVLTALQAMQRGDLSLNALQDTSYENKWAKVGTSPARVLKAEEARKEAEVRYATWARENHQRQGLSPETAQAAMLDTETKLYVNNNRENPRWKALIGDAVTVYGNPSAVTDDAKLAKLREAKVVYDHLKTNNPGYLESTLKPSEKDNTFFQMVDVYQNLRGIPEKEAFRRAAAFIQQPPEPPSGTALKELKEIADGLDLAPWLPWGTASTAHVQVRRDILKVATTIAADRDIPVDKAVEAARDIVVKRSVLLNGNMLTGSPYVSPENTPYWQTRLDEIAKQYGTTAVTASGVGGISSGSDLSVRPMAGGKYFTVIHAKTGEPIVVPKVGPDGKYTTPEVLKIHPNEIGVIQKDAQSARQATIAEAQQRAPYESSANTPDRLRMEKRIEEAPGNTPAEKALNAQKTLIEQRKAAREKLSEMDAAKAEANQSVAQASEDALVAKAIKERRPWLVLGEESSVGPYMGDIPTHRQKEFSEAMDKKRQKIHADRMAGWRKDGYLKGN